MLSLRKEDFTAEDAESAEEGQTTEGTGVSLGTKGSVLEFWGSAEKLLFAAKIHILGKSNSLEF